MGELIIGADAEQILVDYLAAELPPRGFDVPVGTRLDRLPGVPTGRAADSLLVFRTGGTKRTLKSDSVTVTLEARSTLESRAERLGATALALLHAADGLVLGGSQIYSVTELGGLGNLPDVLGNPRYTALLAVHIAGVIA